MIGASRLSSTPRGEKNATGLGGGAEPRTLPWLRPATPPAHQDERLQLTRPTRHTTVKTGPSRQSATGVDARAAADKSEPPSETVSERVWLAVASIPSGQVATYGQIAALASLPGGARRVGRVLARLPSDSRLPWHRVVSASGRISLPGEAGERQRRLLQAEGVECPAGRVSLHRHHWPLKPRLDTVDP